MAGTTATYNHPVTTFNLQSLGAAPGATITRDVTIVFTATGPSVGNVVVGWYKKAQIWRNLQRKNGRVYFARARTTNCTLLPVDERVLIIPRPGRADGNDAWVFGRSNIRYVSGDDENTEFVRKLRAYIEDPFQADLLGNGGHGQNPFPRRVDPLRRAKVEKAAIACVIDYYRGYDCTSVEQENKGWDLELRRGPRELFVEVKGCSGSAVQAELTPNEYSAMQRRRNKYRLAIVTSALDDPRVSVFRFNKSDGTWRDQSNNRLHLREKTGVKVSC